MPPLPVSVVILAYNSAPFLPICLHEVARSRGVDLEVIVVDNASADDGHAIAQAHPAVTQAIRSDVNTGCAGGNNIGWSAAKHPCVVFLNPDCAVAPDAIRHLIQPLAQDPSIGLTGARLYYPNTRCLQHAGGFLHPNAMAEHYGIGQQDHTNAAFTESRDVEYVTGAFFAMRRADLQALGGFDEEFFPAYYEETDLCWRIRRSGLRVRYVAEAIGWHHESVGLGILSPRMVRTSYRARMIWAVKNLTPGEWLARFLPFELRWFAGPFGRGYRLRVLRSYASGARFALKCLLRGRRRPAGVHPRLPVPSSGPPTDPSKPPSRSTELPS